ncbi:TCB1 [[Candida] subhashii]|uniref:TCB1 n=1 Tax=[Candida] subhashii TaxID=561895 RepID=A0A8J5QT53_9ASCO|nr:TCB1 [[Candida] subhashii]KAG7666099.1 TCB1 [[Candida] subhashii]
MAATQNPPDAAKSTDPNELIKAPEQIEIEQVPSTDKAIGQVQPSEKKVNPIIEPRKDVSALSSFIGSRESLKKNNTAKSNVSLVNLTPSEDLDLSNIKTKPPSRKPVDVTFRGWKEVGRYEEEDKLTEEDELVDLLSKTSIFDNYIPPAAIGDWYHNVGYLIGGALISWLIGWFGFSAAPLFFVMVVFSLLYRASVKKYRALLREEAQREFSVKRIESDYETMDWSNLFLEKFWFYLEPSISQIVCENVNPILASSPAPAFIQKLWIDSFTLGTKPPRVERVKTMQGTPDDVVVMDWEFSFTPNTITDSSTKQIRNNINQKATIKITVFGITIPIAVCDVAFRGYARIRMRMMTSFPHIETVNVSMLEPPQFDFNSKILGDMPWYWEVLCIPGLYPFINEMVKKYVGSMLYHPLSFQLNVQQLLSGYSLDSAIGVLAITADSARGLKGFSTIGNTLDPYLTFGYKDKVLAKTKVIDDTSEPVWKETVYIPVSSLSEPLNISVIDFNDFRKDRTVGVIQFDVEQLLDQPKQPSLTCPFLRNNKPVGELKFGAVYMPTIEPIKQADGSFTPPPDLNTGIARIEIVEARHLKGGDKGASSYAQLKVNAETVLTTSTQKNTNTPGWGSSTEQIIFDRAKTRIKVNIKDNNDNYLGQVSTNLNSLIDATQVEHTWFPLAKGGEVRITATWKPVALEGASGSGGYTPPIGAVRISVKHAEDLRNLEAIGKVDPYVRLLVNGFERARTIGFDSTLNPVYNEIHYVTVSSPNQKLTIEVMDYEPRSQDRTLGSFDVTLTDIIQKDETGKYIEYIDEKDRTNKLIHKKGPKGSVTYSLSFYPALPVMSLQDIKDEEEEKKKEEEERKKQEAGSKANSKADLNKDEQIKNDTETLSSSIVDDDEEEGSESQKLKLSLEELIEYRSGIFIYEIIDGTLSKDDVYLQAFFDNYGYPNFTSWEIKKKKTKIGLTGDVVIKELDWSKANFRISKRKDDNRATKAVAETTIPTLQLLKNCYYKPSQLKLAGAGDANFTIQCSWIPLIYESGIPPQDSINNAGMLTVEVIRAEGLPAADSNGKSDPFMQVYLNNDKEEFLKTKKIKKTLDPVWNESGTTEVANKFDSVLRLVCYDWDLAESNDLLGIGEVALKDYDTRQGTQEAEVDLFGENGEKSGKAYIKLSFKPAFVMTVKPRGTTSIGLSAVGNVGRGVGKGVGTVGKGVGTVGKGVGTGIRGLRRGLGLGGGSDKD